MARAPKSLQRMPARFIRCWTRCLAADSTAPEPMGKHDRRRHQLRRFVAGVTKHQTLIARALFGRVLAIGCACIHALGDVRRLFGDDVLDVDLVRVKTPLIQPKWAKMPLGARFALLTTHDRRHLWQAEQVRSQL